MTDEIKITKLPPGEPARKEPGFRKTRFAWWDANVGVRKSAGGGKHMGKTQSDRADLRSLISLAEADNADQRSLISKDKAEAETGISQQVSLLLEAETGISRANIRETDQLLTQRC